MSTPPIPVPNNYIVLRAGKFDMNNGTGAIGLRQLFADIESTKPAQLVIHFHGGLVPRKDGEKDAAELNQLYTDAGGKPLFVIWETGWTEIVDQNLPKIFDEPIFKRILRRVTQFVKGKLEKALLPGVAKSTDDLPLSLGEKIQSELNAASKGGELFKDIPIEQLSTQEGLTPEEERFIRGEIAGDAQLEGLAQRIANSRQTPSVAASRSATAQGSTESLMSPDVLDDIAPMQPGAKGILSMAMLAKHIVVVVGATISRFVRHRDHGPYLTIIEEVLREFYVRNAGRFLWEGIKNEVGEAFGEASDCGGTALVESLTNLWGKGIKPQVTLVGHSAGSIYISRLLKELHKATPPDFQVNIVFIAPACTFAVFADALKVGGKRISGLRIFGMGNEREMKDAIAGSLYPASLLYFVSGVVEDERDMPLLGMERYYSPPYMGDRFETIALVREFEYLKRKNAFAWAAFTGGEGANCDMKSHGSWINMTPATRESLLTIIKNGYGYA